MLRRVARDDVTIGMFIQKMEGSWLHHPFWRRGFLLSDPRDLEKLRASEVEAVIVDDERGAAPAPEKQAAEPASPSSPARAARRERPIPAPLRRVVVPAAAAPACLLQPCSAAEEFARANRIVKKSKRAVMRMFGELRLGKAVSAAALSPLVEEISASVTRNPSALIGIARLKSKDEYTYMHSVAVCALMINLARALELDEALIRDIGMAGMLHDVGKMAVPEAVLNKPGKLDEAEFALIRDHPSRGHAMLLGSEGIPEVALDVSLHHHEKYDGSGYPDGLAGDAISLAARMGAICDVYDAITSARPYKEAWQPAEAIGRMLEWDGHFDPALLAAFVRSIGIYPVGTLVRLRSNRLGVVIAANDAEPTRPKVRAFYSIMERSPIAPETLIVGTSLRCDQIIRHERPEHWNLDEWDMLRDRLIAGRG